MTTQDQMLQMRGQRMVDGDGDKVGKIDEIYLDQETDRPEWALVNTGLFGTKSTFIPLAEAQIEGDVVRVPYDKSQIKDAPKMEASGEISQEEEAELYRYYGIEYTESRSDTGLPDSGDTGTTATTGTTDTDRDMDADRGVGMDRDTDRDRDLDADRDRDSSATATTGRGVVGEDTSGPETDDAITRSEEELRIDKDRRTIGTARLRKYIDTERVRETVPVEHEEVRVEREPVTEANMGAATTGGDLTEEEHEVTLTGEEVDVDKRVVPKERIRLDKETVRDQVEVNEDVRKERVDIDGGNATDATDRDRDRDRDRR